MARSPSWRPLAAWAAFGLIWSCSSKPGPGTSDGSGGRNAAGTAGTAGTPATAGASDVGGAANNQAGGGQSGASAGVAGSVGGGSSGVGGSSSSDLGGAPAGGTAGSAAGGTGNSGAGGSNDLTPYDGHCGQGWAASGSAPNLQGSVTPVADSTGNWSFSFGRYRFVVAASRGARIIEFSIDGNNLIDPTQGSTFWPSPQQAFTWPPPTEIDSDAYAAVADATSVSLTGKVSKTLNLSVHKRFSVNAASGIVSLEYQLVNESKMSASWAPWEVTRVRAGGYTFAPKGPGNRTITEDFPALPLSLLPPAPAANGIEWLNYPSLTLTQDNYITEFDGAEGWLAHANKFGTSLLPVLFVKSFVDAPDASLPENQAEIQLWTSGTADPKLIEVEEQGALQVLAAGASLSWTVHWSACELPSSVMLSAGSAELAALARAHAVKP